MELLNLSTFKGINKNDVAKLLPIFFNELNDTVSTLKSEMSASNFDGINQSIHKIGGIAKVYGAEEVLKTINDIKHTAHDENYIETNIKLITTSVFKVREYLEKEMQIALDFTPK